MTETTAPFWQTKRLNEMTRSEWESLCDGCGRCCLHKVEDEDNGDIYETAIACHLLDEESCLCSDYKNRKKHVPDCIQLTIKLLNEIRWLPESCAYRRINEGKSLEWWHPLISGTHDTVHEAGISIRGLVAATDEDISSPEDILPYIMGKIDT